MNQARATLKRGKVSLSVLTADELAAQRAREAQCDVIRQADLERLREIAAERGIAFHPATTAEKMRKRLIED